MGQRNPHIVIIGAGMVGSYCALHLRACLPDAAITVLDRNPCAYDGASSGNMGGFATCEVRPLARPGNLLRAILWSLDPLAPFTLRLRYLPDYLPWALNFIKSALTPGHTAHVVAAQEALMTRAREAHLAALDATPLSDLIAHDGAICVYRTRARLQQDWKSRWRLFRNRGEHCEVLSSVDLQERLPDLDPGFRHAVHVPAILHWKSPAVLLRGLHQRLREAHVDIVAGDVTQIGMRGRKTDYVQLASTEQMPCDQLVVAAGAWSTALCNSLGDHVPLDTERGYSTTLPQDQLRIRNLLLFPSDEFVATPMLEGLRIGGTVELAGLKAPPDFRRTAALVKLMKTYFPDLDESGRNDWMGFRPSIPDGLPVIGRSPRVSNTFYAFGHGHVGVTQSAITGKLIAQELTGQQPEVDLGPYSIARFH